MAAVSSPVGPGPGGGHPRHRGSPLAPHRPRDGRLRPQPGEWGRPRAREDARAVPRRVRRAPQAGVREGGGRGVRAVPPSLGLPGGRDADAGGRPDVTAAPAPARGELVRPVTVVRQAHAQRFHPRRHFRRVWDRAQGAVAVDHVGRQPRLAGGRPALPRGEVGVLQRRVQRRANPEQHSVLGGGKAERRRRVCGGQRVRPRTNQGAGQGV
mmetsp:Transcript_282/g.416  ORF Transcript_282/g.416 Transcript_282/m.416 type:complete len:211 (-) Transcript_282:1252-1884(-)